MAPRVTRWGVTKSITPFFDLKPVLPMHSYCPAPLVVARDHVDSPADPPLERVTTPPAGLSLSEWKGGCEFALHPMLLAQIRSVRDEAAYGPYVEWFSNERNSSSRLFTTRVQDAFSYVWSSSFFSWLFPPFDLAAGVAVKLVADRSRGAVIVRTANAGWFDDLRARCWLMFTIKGAEGNLVPRAPAVDLTVFMIDDHEPRELPQCVSLSLPENVDTLFRPPKCPFVHDVWKAGLAHYPDPAFVTRVLRGIKFGCSLGYHGPRLMHRTCRNPARYEQYKSQLAAIIAKDESKGFRCGPFPGHSPPLFNLICNPISGAPKRFSPDEIRMVKDMSFPRNGTSVNELVDEGVTRNITVRMICNLIATLGKGTLIWTFDVQSAYKQIKVIMDDWHLQGETSPAGFAWASVCDFGGRNSGHRWEEYGSAIEFMVRHHTLVSAIARYVDDFIALVRPSIDGLPDIKRAHTVRTQVIELCSILGVPIPEPKQKGPSTRVVGVLGWTFDTVLMQLSVTDERRRMCLAMLSEWLNRSSASMRELQSLVGLLQYLVECFRWGKAFLGYAIKLSHSRPHSSDRVKLSEGFRADMRWWHTIIDEWNGISLFYEVRWIDSSNLGFEVDASRKGHGAYAESGWYSHAWSESELRAAERSKDLSMPFLEALAIAYGCATFGHLWSGKKIYCLSDCQPAEAAINARYSRDAGLRQIIRSIGRLACRFNFDLRIRHIEGLKNVRADPLSRLDVPAFLDQAPLHAASLRVHALAPPDLIFA